MTRVRAFGERILVVDIHSESTLHRQAKEAGLVLVVAEQNQPKPTAGTVVSVGNGPLVTESGVRIGDRVTFAKYAGTFVMDDGVQYRSLEFHEVISFTPKEENEGTSEGGDVKSTPSDTATERVAELPGTESA